MSANGNGSIRGTAVVTGASSGIGAVYADRLAAQGYDLILVARRADRLQALSVTLENRHHVNVATVVADLADEADLTRVEKLIAADKAISLLVNNAGVGGQSVVAKADPAGISQQIKVNIVALTRLTSAVLPGLIARGKGAVVNIASVLAFSTAYGGIYSGTKAYVVNFTEALRRELEGTGVRAQAVLPGPIKTEFWEIAGADVNGIPPERIMTAEDLVDASLAGLAQGEWLTAPGLNDADEVDRYLGSRDAFFGQLVAGKPAARYAE